jgi:LysR family transcriptional regulator, cell division regulator
MTVTDDGVPKGPLAIGSMETTAAVRLPSLLARFHRRFPAVQLTLRTAPTAALIADGHLE